MQQSQWLQGGPFLEVSFLLELNEDKKKTIQHIIDYLPKLRTKVEIVDENVDEIIDFFNKGYLYDEEDPQSIALNTLQLRLYVHLFRKRKATLQLDKVSSNAILVNFWFNGDECVDQLAKNNEEFAEFTTFLQDLYSIYEFKIGGIAIEQDVLELLGVGETYPNEGYRYENVSPDFFLNELSSFLAIIWNEKYEKLKSIPYHHKRLDKEGILIVTGEKGNL